MQRIGSRSRLLSHLCMAFVFLSHGADRSAAQDVEESLGAYEQWLEKLDPIQFEFRESVFRGTDSDASAIWVSIGDCLRKGDSWGMMKRGGKGGDLLGRDECVVRRDHSIMVQNHADRHIASATLTPEATAAFPHFAFLGEVKLLFGQVPGSGGLTLPELFRTESSTVSAESTGGVVTIVSTGEWGDLRLELASDHGHMPRRLTFHKSSEHWVTPHDRVIDTEVGGKRLVSWSYEAEFDGSTQVEDIHLPTEFTTTTTYDYGGSALVHRSVCQVTNVSRDVELPPGDFPIRTDLPDGVEVQVDEAPGVRFEWRDGKVVRVFDGEAVDALHSSRFKSRRRIAGRLAFSVLVIALLAATPWVWRKVEKMKSGDDRA